MKTRKLIAAFSAIFAAGMSFGGTICTCTTSPVAVDAMTIDGNPIVDSLQVSYDAAWIGGDANATVVIADNGAEVKRATGAGDFTHTLTGDGRHELTYTTYIDGVAQDEVYTATVYKNWTCNISDVAAKQRYPWNGKVDITYTLTGDVTAGGSPEEEIVLSMTASNRVDGTTYAAAASALSGDTGTAEGAHHVIWDLNAQGIEFVSDDVLFTVAYVPIMRYCVIDLSGGANASSYPVTYVASVPSGGFNTYEYKTTKLVLRRIEPGTFIMNGSYSTTLTKPFYCGVFEVTQKQWELVTGSNPSSSMSYGKGYGKGNSYPVHYVSYNMIRGSSAGAGWPGSSAVDGSSFLGKLQARTGIDFDLPTEAQWEYACRAGTTTTYSYGDSADGNYMWYSGNSSSQSHVVGTKQPNAWGLYDMHGNVWEWCLDWYGNLVSGVTDPQGSSSGSGRVERGGCWGYDADYCTSSRRVSNGPLIVGYSSGFRLVRTLSNTEGERSPEAVAGAERADALCAAEAAPVAIDSRMDVEPVLDSVVLPWDAAWIGGDANATVVIADNGTEVRRATGAGEFTLSGIGRHELTYTTYIGGVAQDEVYTATVYGTWKYEVVDSGAVIAETTQTSGTVTIPTEINGYPVTGIASGAFKDCTGLTSITIPNSVTSIGYGAFDDCSGLIGELIIPDSVREIDNSAFFGCSGLSGVVIGHGVKYVGNQAFAYCTNLRFARIPITLRDVVLDDMFLLPNGAERPYGFKIEYYDELIVGDKVEHDTWRKGYTARGLPKGLTYSAKTGKLSGTVNNAGVYEVTFSKKGEKDVVVQIVVRKAYAVTFDANGGMPKTQSISLFPGSSFVLPDDPTRVGYAFMGWWTEKSGGEKVTESTTFSKDAYAQLYAQWEANRYTVVFDANGGTGTMDAQQMVYDVTTPLFGNGFALSGSLLRGWATSADGTVAYRDGEKVKNLSEVADDVVTLYAVWQKKPDWVLACEASFGEIGRVSLDGNDNIVVTLMGDVTGTVEIPDNVGAVTIDLNGHSMVGNGGGLGETALPDGPAIRVVKGDGEGDNAAQGVARLVIVDTSDDEKGQIAGGGESAGIEVAEDVATGLRLDVEEGVGVFNGDGSEQELKPKLVVTGKVTVPKSWKVGQKVTWKATADKGSVFARWEGPLVDSLNLTRNERRNPSLAFAVPEGFETNMVTAVFIPLDDDGLYTLGITQTEFEFKEAVSDVCVTDDSQSYVTATASGLPSGLKFDAKKMCITGAPTKGGVYWVQIKAKNASGYQWSENVKVTVSGDGKEAKEPKLTRTAYHPLTVVPANAAGGTATGTGVYAEGKKVSISAKPAKGYVFAGWYRDPDLTEQMAFAADDWRKASQSVVVPEVRYLFARFVTERDDGNNIALAVDGVEMAAGAGHLPYQTNVMCGVYMEWPVAVETLSLPKVAVAGLPSGLKFTAKPVTSKIGSGKTAVVVTNVPANTIYGAPTTASKVDAKTGAVKPSVVKVTVTTASKAKVVYEIDVTVDAMKEWAVGTFDGYVRGSGTLAASGEEGSGEGSDMGVAFPKGLATVTVAANGKISGKVFDAYGTWTLSATSFDSYDAESETYVATVIGKNAKMAFTNEVVVSAEEIAAAVAGQPPYRRGVVSGWATSEPPVEWTAWQNLWKTEPWKTEAKPFAKAPALAIDAGTRDACPYLGTITLKFAASGAVTASGKFVTGQDARGKDIVYSASCSSVLVPEADAAGAGRPPYRVFLYFPPKAGKFEGYADEIQLVWDGVGFTVE